MSRRKRHLWATGLVMALSALTGCQTNMAGMTLPSGRYLTHPPQYFPPDPDFPLTRELAYQEEQAGLLRPAGAVIVPGPAGPPIPALPGGNVRPEQAMPLPNPRGVQ
jgi:hypothetical protein